MKSKKALVGALVLMAGLTACQSGDKSGETYMTINGTEISKQRYESQLDLYTGMLIEQFQLGKSIEASFIQEEVMRADLEKNGITLTDSDFQEDYDAEVEKSGGKEGFQSRLDSMGATDEQMRDSLRYQTIARKHLEWYEKNHAPSEEEKKAYFDQHKDELKTVTASHILVATKEEADQVKQRLNAGEKFEDIAKEVSLDSSAANGGALSEANPSSYVTEFAQALEKLEIGQISDPVQSQFGYHIIRLDGVKDKMEDFTDQITGALVQEPYQAYIQQLYDSAEVVKEGDATVTETSTPQSTEGTEASSQQSESSQESEESKSN